MYWFYLSFKNMQSNLKKINLLLIILLFSMSCFSQKKNKSSDYLPYSPFSFGIEAGGGILLALNQQSELKTKFKYSIAGLFQVRPVNFLGLETGIRYHNIINDSKFFDVPLIFYLYNKKNQAVLLGPNLIYKYVKGNTDFTSPDLGCTVGVGNQFSEISLSYYPSYNSIIKETFLNMDASMIIILSVKLKLSIAFIKAVPKGRNMNYRKREIRI